MKNLNLLQKIVVIFYLTLIVVGLIGLIFGADLSTATFGGW